jgi:hypothetical protein
MNASAMTSTTPCTTGRSREKIAVTRSWPLPGRLNIVSMMTVPPSNAPS